MMAILKEVPKETLEGIDKFTIRMAKMIGYFPYEAFMNSDDRQKYLQEQIVKRFKQYEKDSSDYSWTTSPDRMGQ
jgi:recombinational DNA repair protein RecT